MKRCAYAAGCLAGGWVFGLAALLGWLSYGPETAVGVVDVA